jgi:hypothetical protein
MRRFAMLGLALMLAGCGYNTWWNAPLTPGYQPYAPQGDAENLREVKGARVELAPLTPQPGDVWPGPVPATPTLQELEQQGMEPQPELPVPGSPLSRGAVPPQASPGGTSGGVSGGTPPALAPQVSHGSSTPPGSIQPGLAPLPVVPPGSPPSARAAPPPGRPAYGQTVQTPNGTGVTTGGTQGYQTLTTPGGGSAIVVPNGNGTSTVIKSDGTIETIPTPK